MSIPDTPLVRHQSKLFEETQSSFNVVWVPSLAVPTGVFTTTASLDPTRTSLTTGIAATEVILIPPPPPHRVTDVSLSSILNPLSQ